MPRTPRTDPYERDWRIRLLPRMGSGKALLRSTLQPKATLGRPCGCAPFLPRFRWYRPESFPRSPLPPCETADAVSKNTAPSPRNARSTVASGMVTSTAPKVPPSTIMAAVPRPRDREPARRTPASTRSAAKSWQACWGPWPATRRMPTRWPLAVICGSAWLKLPAAPAGMPPDRPNGDERALRGVGSEPGDRQDWHEFPAKCAGNPCQSCQSRGRSWVAMKSAWQFFMSFRGPKAHPNRQDWQRISGKERQKFMSVLSVSGGTNNWFVLL